MEHRQLKRFKTRQMVKVGGKLGIVKDISGKGIRVSTVFTPQKREIAISIETPGRIINLLGIIQWIRRKNQLQPMNEIGVLITEAPPEYLDFVNNFKRRQEGLPGPG